MFITANTACAANSLYCKIKSKFMKKLFLVTLLSMVSVLCFCQNFKIDRELGFVDSSDSSKSFLVLTAEGKKADQIKDLLIGTLSKMFAHPDKVISTIGDNVVVVNGYNDDLIDNGDAETINYFTFNYTYRIEIKDQRIKINAPILYNFTNHYKHNNYKRDKEFGPSEQYKFLTGADNSPKSHKFFNDFVTAIKRGINTEDDW